MLKKKMTAFLGAALITFSAFQTVVVCAEEDYEYEETESIDDYSYEDDVPVYTVDTNAIPGWPQAESVTSTAAYVLDATNDITLFSQNADQQLYPAATVKIMTTLLALENSTLDDEVTFTEVGLSGATDGGAHISAQIDEVLTMEQCVYAVMLASANDAAMQIAEYIAGSVDGFVDMMNARAAELGCTGTVFKNPTGLPDEGQYTTAHDMALIMEAALQNEDFMNIASTTSYTIPATNMSGGARTLSGNFQLQIHSSDFYYEGILGGKEGSTAASGATLACGAKKNGRTLICVLLENARESIDTEAIRLLDYGFNQFEMKDLGSDDFSVLEGGKVLLPVNAAPENLTTEETVQEDHIDRTYYYGGIEIGKATCQIIEPEDDSQIQNSAAFMEATENYSASKSTIPYIAIGAAAVVLFLFFLIKIIKVAKS